MLLSEVTNIFRRERTHQTSKNMLQNILPHHHIRIQSQKQKKKRIHSHIMATSCLCIILLFSHHTKFYYCFLTTQTCTVHSFLIVLVGMRVGNITLFILAFVLPFPERWCYVFRDALQFLLVRRLSLRSVCMWVVLQKLSHFKCMKF